ncbi:T9SS type A sorting domain-containing protein [Hymenobacter sp. 15J16-1T3B]|uniref:T9SS type A sorting domain-containing protein n=1 Tax=Hymenobacter sp. 15J16-1T3B TaxID=2886941 RepID=UPI001D12F23F|nr:T9SS type A sorting domain-containing protein [Hymenobacter sp. 15J16-1T3B]MCC3156623.1 T9SS type A sorting domain-containing protein [Hymenobacter sp. 15J16-1T3B]
MFQALPRVFQLLVLCCLLPLSGQAAQFLAGELTYETLFTAPANQYRVKLRLLRDCSGPAFNQTETLSCRVGAPQASCASTDARNFTATLTRTLTTTGHPYCTISPVTTVNQCDPNAPFNYEETYYEAVVTLPPAAEWTLSWEGCCRPALANLQNAAAQPLRLEATLRNQLTVAGAARTIINTSAQYLPQDAPADLVCKGQRTVITFNAYEPDGDSLVYSLTTPLYGCAQPAGYQAYAGGTVILSNNPPCVATLPATNSYSPSYPLPSFVLSGACPSQVGTPSFQFSPLTGTFSFTPTVYLPENGPTDRNRNHYAVVGRVTEFRRINGTYYEVGSITRNMLVAIIDCELYQFANHNPRLDPLMRVSNAAQPVPLTDTVRVAPGQAVNVVLTGSDPDSAHQLSFSAQLQATAPLPTGAFQAVTSTPNRLQLTFTPPVGQAEGRYPVLVRAEDNNCPTRGVYNAVVWFRVSARVLSAASAATPVLTTAAPNPFTDDVTFRVAGATGPTRLVVSNVLGQVVAELPLRPAADGSATATWRPATPLPTGVYLARVAGTGQTMRLLRR